MRMEEDLASDIGIYWARATENGQIRYLGTITGAAGMDWIRT